MIQKYLRYIKAVVFILACLGFIDLLLHPKGTQYADANLTIITDYYRIILEGLAIACFVLLIVSEFLSEATVEKFKKYLTVARVVFLLLMLVFVQYFLRVFYFTQSVDYIIVTVHLLPIPFVINDLTLKLRIKSVVLVSFGLLLLIPTLVYFNYFYVPYEDYSGDIPIMFVHYQIRNWLCVTGVTLLLITALRYLNRQKQIN